jgi:hypothetical protein
VQTDHDNPWEGALDYFLLDCLNLLFPDVAEMVAEVIPDDVVNLEQEMARLSILGETSERRVDKLVKVDGNREKTPGFGFTSKFNVSPMLALPTACSITGRDYSKMRSKCQSVWPSWSGEAFKTKKPANSSIRSIG